MATPGKGLISAFGDHLTPVNDTHLVCFGPDPECSAGITLDNLDTVKAAVVHLLPENKQGEAVINRVVSEYSPQNCSVSFLFQILSIVSIIY